jgi:fatty acid desaturase
MDAADTPTSCAKPVAPRWYRCPVERELMKELLQRSDLLGLAQAGGFLLLLVCIGTATVVAGELLPWWTVPPLALLYGSIAQFALAGEHELIHNTVFRSRWLNGLFVRIYSFIGWTQYRMFDASHDRHHVYTLHQPHDLEVVLPASFPWWKFLRDGIINVGAWRTYWGCLRGLFGRVDGPWPKRLLAEEGPAFRASLMRWAWTLMIGHGLIVAVAIVTGWWALPLVTTCVPFIGAWLLQLLAMPQHLAMEDAVPDARRCCRSFTTNPIFQFIYWHMNYHIEHHMFAAVPCYRLGRLHRAIAHDLPPTPHGVIATWRDIRARENAQARTMPSPPIIAAVPA